MSRIDAFLDLLIKQKGSDLHLVSGNAPRLRLYGEIHPVKYRVLTTRETTDLLYEIMPSHLKPVFESQGGIDFAYEIPGLSRFRVNAYRHLDGVGAVFRSIPNKVQSIDQLKLPTILKNLSHNSKGLILITGPTGSGKSTTMAAMVDNINTIKKGHIITIEDPVEFVHENRACLMSQREINSHTENFSAALHNALREDPDVILLGEMRDLETISLALTAAEMGILVLATLHTNGAAAAIDRIVNAFPAGEEPYIRAMLSTSLCGIIAQQLIRTADNKGRIAAFEILLNNTATANIIREGKTEQLENIIQGGALQGMLGIDTSLRRLLDEKQISGEEAYNNARNKKSFEQYREQDQKPKTTKAFTDNQFGMH